MKIYYLYKIVNQINGKNYIGQSVRPKQRWYDHRLAARNNPNQAIHHAMKKYGIENFTFEIIAICRTYEDADEVETLLVKQYDSHISQNKGYNVSFGGSNAPKTEEWIRKVSSANRGKKRTPEQILKMSLALKGRVSPMKGKHHTQSAKEKLSKACKGRILTEEHKENIGAGLQGRTLTEEHKQKLSISKMGVLNPQFGRTQSEETKNKRSNALKGARNHNFGKPAPHRYPVSAEQIKIILSSNLSERKLAAALGLSRGIIRRILKGIY